MSNLLPEKWSEGLERVHDKVGHFLTRLMPWKKEEHSPERITADTLPAFMQFGGPTMSRSSKILNSTKALRNQGFFFLYCPLESYLVW